MHRAVGIGKTWCNLTSLIAQYVAAQSTVQYSTVHELSRSSQYRGALIAPLPTDNDNILNVNISLSHCLQVPNLFIDPMPIAYVIIKGRTADRAVCAIGN
jgi:hypothetical protein